MSAAAAAVKAALLALTDENTRKKLGWVLAAVLAPVLLLVALLCALASGGAEHNRSVVELCFHGGALPADAPAEYQAHLWEMQAAFSHLGISQRSEISIDYLLHGGASDHMAVESLRESHIDHIRLLSLYRQHGIIVRLCSQSHRNSSVVHDKIVQYLVFFLSAVFQIVQADPFR